MALDVRLFNGSQVALLSVSSVYGIRPGSALGELPAERVFSRPWKRGYAPLVGVNYGNRAATLNLNVRAASLDTWTTTAQAVEQVLLDAERYHESGGVEGSAAYLDVQLNGMTNATRWDVLGGTFGNGGLFQTAMTVTTAPILTDVPLSLVLKPWGRNQLPTQSASGTLNNGGGTGGTSDSYTLTAPAGQYDTPCRLTFQPVSTSDWRRVIIARKSRGDVSNFIFAFECETTAGTGYTAAGPPATYSSANTAVATAHGGNVLRVSSGAGGTLLRTSTITINDNLSDFFGKYRVFLRVDAGASAFTAAQLKYGGTAGSETVTNTAVTVNNADNQLVDLGIMQIPITDAPAAAPLTSFVFSVYTTITAGVDVDLDCWYLVPVDEEYLDVELSANSSNNDQLVSDSLLLWPLTYRLNSSGDLQAAVQPTMDSRFSVPRGVDSRWFVLVFESASASGHPQGHNLADTWKVTLDYYPLWALTRAA